MRTPPQFTPSALDRPDILHVLFHPRAGLKNLTPPSSTEFEVIVEDGVTLGCRFFLAGPDAASILYFHGNGETVQDYDQIAPHYLEAGLNILIAGYRGYGWSSGEPSVSALLYDSAILLDAFVAHLEKQGLPAEVFVMGRSLGSACCIDIGHRFAERIKGIIIDSGFATTLPLLDRLGCAVDQTGLSERDGFNNLDKIREIEVPTLILHGADDQLIPLNEAVKLQAESGARTKQLFIIPGADHNSLILRGGPTYFDTIKAFTDTVLEKNTWRQRRRSFKEREKKP